MVQWSASPRAPCVSATPPASTHEAWILADKNGVGHSWVMGTEPDMKQSKSGLVLFRRMQAEMRANCSSGSQSQGDPLLP